MDHFNSLPVEYRIAAELFIGLAAICFGVVAAKLRFPSAEAMVRRGDCPECKSRKSLRVTPCSRSSAILTCGKCVSQWLIENTDGASIVHGPGAEPILPPLRMTLHDNGTVQFETDVGIAIFDLRELDVSQRWGIQSHDTPRSKLNYLFRTGVGPIKLDLTPKQAEIAKGNDTTQYVWFAASAGLDIYYLMPKSATELNTTTESRHD